MTAFSNGFEAECWQTNWCCRCIKDDMGLAPEGTFCPIMTHVFLDNEVPPQWTPGTDDLRDRYHCSEFETSAPQAREGVANCNTTTQQEMDTEK